MQELSSTMTGFNSYILLNLFILILFMNLPSKFHSLLNTILIRQLMIFSYLIVQILNLNIFKMQVISFLQLNLKECFLVHGTYIKDNWTRKE